MAKVDYDDAAALGPQAVPHLSTLVAGADTVLAAKALYLAGVIGGPAAKALLDAAAGHPDPIVRIAASAALRTMRSR
ncbi:hypothetical protein [Actinokineospora bangkokensis]|uniref:HEAT repeat domain-containing protein n=1 Tax=Actinokineospora bangkokensis TaxID=1193682 RepID=A0A1Q9LTM5_9PSEU|nr:hypothetical protein [Actinokineospora bangkokensis]OLR95397.1 hypothetical protein BJP25_06500 [Actinokineospora bangkokensis]